MNHSISNIHDYPKQTNSFFRFILVGVVNTLVGLSIIFTLLQVLGLPYFLSTFIGNSIGALVSFQLNKTFTFQSNKPVHRSAPLFILVVVVSYFSAYSFSDYVADGIGSFQFNLFSISNENIAVLLGTGLYTVFNYLGQKYFVFIEKAG